MYRLVHAEASGTGGPRHSYHGCFENEGNARANGHEANLTFDSCAAKAAYSEVTAFGLESPQGSGKARAYCLLLNDQHFGMHRTGDDECEDEIDAAGHRLGGVNRLAVYSAEHPLLFVDSGANDGMWSLLAAAHGCKVIAVEPQLLCLRHIAAAAHLNGLPISAHNNMLGNSSFSAKVRTDECAGTAMFLTDGRIDDAMSVNSHATQDSWRTTIVHSVKLDELVAPGERIALWHIDTEGAEVLVLQSAARIFAEGRIDRVIMEWEPSRFSEFGLTVTEAAKVAMGVFKGWRCQRLCEDRPVDWAFIPHPNIWSVAHTDVYCVRPGMHETAHDPIHSRRIIHRKDECVNRVG